MSAALLEVEGLATHFYTRQGVVKAVDGVSFSLAAGEIIGLVGESGSGKSVTGFSLLGLVDPPGRIVAGSINLGGDDLIGMPEPELRRRRGQKISMIFQDPTTTLNPMLTIGQQIGLALLAHEQLSEKALRSRATEALNRVGIPDAAARLSAYPHQFSGGMRQRVAIAIALLHSPALIIADEPTTALDVSIQAQILHEMRELSKETGAALIWISHDLATVSSIASRLLVMYAGRIVEEGPTATVLRSPRHPYTAGLLGSMPGLTEPGAELRQIPGTAPSLLALSPGCAFAPRCSRAGAACAVEPGATTALGRTWRCYHPLDGEASR